jgi:hypothetical protein
MAPEKLEPPKLKVKRLDYYYSFWTKSWKYKSMNSRITVEERRPSLAIGENDPWKDFAFVVIRTVPRSSEVVQLPTFKIVIKSDYLCKGLKDVIKYWPGISWNLDPLTLDPEILLGFVPKLHEYTKELEHKKPRSDEDTYIFKSVNLLLDTLHTDYAETLSTIQHMVSHGEITFDLLYAIFVPQTILLAECNITGEPRTFKLLSHTRTTANGKPQLQLTVESINFTDMGAKHGTEIGKVQTMISVPYFKGINQITDLDVYPLQFHPKEKQIREKLLSRGRRWLSLAGVHHLQYDGIAVRRNTLGLVKHNVESRVMIDRAMFRKTNPQYIFPAAMPMNNDPAANFLPNNASVASLLSPPVPPGTMPPPPMSHPPGGYTQPSTPWPPAPIMPPPMPVGGLSMPVFMDSQPVHTKAVKDEPVEVTDEQLILTPAVVYGFSLSDKLWLEFNIEKLTEIRWNEESFSNLVLPDGQKELLRSLVEAHNKDALQFDDFVTGKGLGLVVNLYGPPGVGKTFSAEATSEHVRKPLYLVGASDLSVDANGLDSALERIFNVAQEWNAIVLIDEADVFLEKRSLHDMLRNAAVSVFLRHIEYYQGILFLTTNRVRVFDDAFLSRVHVALHLPDLSLSSKHQIWTAFLRKINASHLISEEEVARLAARQNVNGRQIKNAARTAKSLALARGQELSIVHLEETLDAMQEFMVEFKRINTHGEADD